MGICCKWQYAVRQREHQLHIGTATKGTNIAEVIYRENERCKWQCKLLMVQNINNDALPDGTLTLYVQTSQKKSFISGPSLLLSRLEYIKEHINILRISGQYRTIIRSQNPSLSRYSTYYWMCSLSFFLCYLDLKLGFLIIRGMSRMEQNVKSFNKF